MNWGFMRNRGVLVSKRRPHAALDLSSRRLKGMKIERLLDLSSRAQPIRLLEIGTGAGGIASYFAAHPALHCEVDAVDVHDSRLISEGYRFQKVCDTTLPFSDMVFDVVISNHVIEHVGDQQAQCHHLSELQRVLSPTGVAYLAVPNRWMLIEPHYRAAFLSWLPHGWRSQYLRILRKGNIYDCEPLEMRVLEHMLMEAGFQFRNICIKALRETFNIEHPISIFTRLLRKAPDRWLEPLTPLIPTLIYRLELRRPAVVGL